MIIEFNIEEDWKFKLLTHKKSQAEHKRLQYNTDLFGEWLIGLFEKYTDKINGKYQIYPNIYMNSSNLSILKEHISKWDYLNYSPITDDSLKDNEVKINDSICKGESNE